MTRLLIGTSVLIKWFHSSGEPELNEARTLRAAHLSGELDAHIVDLAVYEVGNVLVRSLNWPGGDVADQIDDLLAICGTPLVPTPQWLRDASTLATEHNLPFYDAVWAATARGLDVPLVSADTKLIDALLAESPTQIVQRLRL